MSSKDVNTTYGVDYTVEMEFGLWTLWYANEIPLFDT